MVTNEYTPCSEVLYKTFLYTIFKFRMGGTTQIYLHDDVWRKRRKNV